MDSETSAHQVVDSLTHLSESQFCTSLFQFDPLLVESKQAATVVLMLSSPEEDVQSKACEAIYKFVDKCEFTGLCCTGCLLQKVLNS